MTGADVASAAGRMRVRVGVAAVVILVASSAAGLVISVEIILLPPPMDQTYYVSIAVRGATRRPNVRVCFQ